MNVKSLPADQNVEPLEGFLWRYEYRKMVKIYLNETLFYKGISSLSFRRASARLESRINTSTSLPFKALKTAFALDTHLTQEKSSGDFHCIFHYFLITDYNTDMHFKKGFRMITLLDTVLSSGLEADYVLFDSWFSNPAQIIRERLVSCSFFL